MSTRTAINTKPIPIRESAWGCVLLFMQRMTSSRRLYTSAVARCNVSDLEYFACIRFIQYSMKDSLLSISILFLARESKAKNKPHLHVLDISENMISDAILDGLTIPPFIFL
jgi:hypothetical protein